MKWEPLCSSTPQKIMKKPPFKIGDRVTTRFYPEDSNIVRRVTHVRFDTMYETGWAVSADAGEPCKACGSHGATNAVQNVSAWWFHPAEEVGG